MNKIIPKNIKGMHAKKAGPLSDSNDPAYPKPALSHAKIKHATPAINNLFFLDI